jgi:protocatechuate 3,4-dioxygenase beta subunit
MMNSRILLLLTVIYCVFASGCNGQAGSIKANTTSNSKGVDKTVGGGCDGCEIMYVDMPASINATDTSAGWTESGQKLLLTGTVYQIDGKTPAANIVVYYWQTDNTGHYSPTSKMSTAAKRHGHLRGWVKTDPDGRYAIYTIRPAPYPGRDIPAHIHTSIREPAMSNEYYIDEFVFDDDPLLTTEKRRKLENRGGSGILRVLVDGELQIAEHNIILGLNIPDYPPMVQCQYSGLNVGEDSPSFIPFHAFGPDRGTRACPVCKYGRYHGILYFVGNKPNWENIKQWLVFLERQSLQRGKYLKAYFIYGNENNYSENERRGQLKKIGEELGLKNVALTFVPSLNDNESEVNLNKINPEVESTFIIYKNGNIIDKFISLAPSEENKKMIAARLDSTAGKYFALNSATHD